MHYNMRNNSISQKIILTLCIIFLLVPISCKTKVPENEKLIDAQLMQLASGYVMKRVNQIYWDKYWVQLKDVLTDHKNNIREINSLRNNYGNIDILESFFHVLPDNYRFMQEKQQNTTGKMIDSILDGKKTKEEQESDLSYFEYSETQNEKYRYFYIEGFGKKVNGQITILNILNGEFLEKNTYGESTNFNNSPEKMQEFIGKKISLKSKNIKTFEISEAFLLYLIDLVKNLHLGIIAGLDRILLYKDNVDKTLAEFDGQKQIFLEYLNEYVDNKRFWGNIPIKIIDNMTQADKLYIYNQYLIIDEEVENKWGFIWYIDGSEKTFLLED